MTGRNISVPTDPVIICTGDCLVVHHASLSEPIFPLHHTPPCTPDMFGSGGVSNILLVPVM